MLWDDPDKTHKSGEAIWKKMIQCLEVALMRLIKVEQRRSSSLKIHISPCEYISAIFNSILHSTILYILQ